MRITVASGKGGTGKTTIATSFAVYLASTTPAFPPLFLDCDVEAPNAHLYLQPRFTQEQNISIPIPDVNSESCTACGKCVQVCEYNALALLGKTVHVFPQLCHGCGSCVATCPVGALSETPNTIGILEAGLARLQIDFARGVLNIGEPMAVPVIRQLKKWIQPHADQTVIVDASPGTSCPVVEALRGSDFFLLVTEPTPFGLHDLKLAAQLSRELNIPAGVIINRDGIGDADVDNFCNNERLPILMRVPFDRTIAEGTARGQTLIDIYPEYNSQFQQLLDDISRNEKRT
ncbi:MAG: 4Fe-4S binding protein [Chloroflexi bacterium]|nr:4Fe-4S binding protein [Chloroflexota bacterium]